MKPERRFQIPVLQAALANLQDRLGKGAAAAYLNLAEGPGLRHQSP